MGIKYTDKRDLGKYGVPYHEIYVALIMGGVGVLFMFADMTNATSSTQRAMEELAAFHWWGLTAIISFFLMAIGLLADINNMRRVGLFLGGIVWLAVSFISLPGFPNLITYVALVNGIFALLIIGEVKRSGIISTRRKKKREEENTLLGGDQVG